jgi:formylglycine-generating enzyme required for sulfatase activity
VAYIVRSVCRRLARVIGVPVWVTALIVTLLFAPTRAVNSEPKGQVLQVGHNFRDCEDCPEMVVVPDGSFSMGSSDADKTRVLESLSRFTAFEISGYLSEEQPSHPVTFIHQFAIGKYPVTKGEFAAFVRDTSYPTTTGNCTTFANHKYFKPVGAGWEHPGFTQTDRDPVVCVSWDDARAYVAWLNAKLRGTRTYSVDDDGPYHLPTEAEWEYAARAGTQTARWWGDDIGVNNAVCDGCGSIWDKRQTAPVGSFRPNAFGLYDVLGNVWQWTLDCWNGSYAGAPSNGTAWAVAGCPLRVIRGGGWMNTPWVLRSAGRSRNDTGNRTNFIGFRLAKALR